MASQKLENLLNLSLEAAPQQREQSLELPVGVVEDRWELIIKYHGDLREALRRAGFPALLRTEYLLPGYAIMTAGREEIERLSLLPEIDYVEKPKALYEGEISIGQGKLFSCVQEVTDREPYLSGQGTLIGIPDSGIDYKTARFWTARDGAVFCIYGIRRCRRMPKTAGCRRRDFIMAWNLQRSSLMRVWYPVRSLRLTVPVMAAA